jgi:hypothetical protein
MLLWAAGSSAVDVLRLLRGSATTAGKVLRALDDTDLNLIPQKTARDFRRGGTGNLNLLAGKSDQFRSLVIHLVDHAQQFRRRDAPPASGA